MRNKFEILLCLLYYFIILTKELTIAAALKKLDTEYAKKNEIPYMVSIRTEDHHICDGVITDKGTVVTAAHCLIDKGGYYLLLNISLIIVAGTVGRTGSEIIRESESILIHPAFDVETKQHNLAVITLKDSLPLDNKTIKSVELAKTEFPEGTQCIISGWGSTNDSVSDQLQKSKVYIMSKDECVANYAGKNYEITDKHICAGVPNGRTGFCYGDRGGPLVCNDFLYGIASFDFGCGLQGFPSIYSSVKEYTRFIEASSNAYLENEDGNYKNENFSQSYRNVLFALILFVLFVLCALYFNSYK